jgi:DNA-binding response OmpR family regulator
MQQEMCEIPQPATPPLTMGYQAQILIAENDVPLAHFLKRGLHSDKYALDLVHDGEAALEALGRTQYSLLIMDLNLPKLDGMMLLTRLRPTMPNLPVLVLTDRNRMEDPGAVLDGGADDCLVKPFSFHELSARVRALLRRNGKASRDVLQVGDLVLNRPEFRVERSGKKIDLTAKEFALLEYLMINARSLVNRTMIMENVWKTSYDARTNLVDVYVKYVRDKVDSGNPVKLIRTVRGVGYVLTDN